MGRRFLRNYRERTFSGTPGLAIGFVLEIRSMKTDWVRLGKIAEAVVGFVLSDSRRRLGSSWKSRRRGNWVALKIGADTTAITQARSRPFSWLRVTIPMVMMIRLGNPVEEDWLRLGSTAMERLASSWKSRRRGLASSWKHGDGEIGFVLEVLVRQLASSWETRRGPGWVRLGSTTRRQTASCVDSEVAFLKRFKD
jgi:hypothetical protein